MGEIVEMAAIFREAGILRFKGNGIELELTPPPPPRMELSEGNEDKMDPIDGQYAASGVKPKNVREMRPKWNEKMRTKVV